MKKLLIILLSFLSMKASANWGEYPATPITTTENALTHLETDYAREVRTPADEPRKSFYMQPNIDKPDLIRSKILSEREEAKISRPEK